MTPPTPKRMTWRMWSPAILRLRLLCWAWAACSCRSGRVSSQYLISTRWVVRRCQLSFSCDVCECGEVQDEKHVLFFCKCAEVCKLRLKYRDLFEEMFKTLRVFAPSSTDFIPFLACHHTVTDSETNAFLNQDSYRLLKFVSDLVSFFDTGWICFTNQLPPARVSGCRPTL